MDTLIDSLLSQQRELTPVESFSVQENNLPRNKKYRDLIPLSQPKQGEQYAFEVDLDICSGCKSCVVACHSLNGLDERESWRDVGELITKDCSTQQFVATACHHCQEPACLEGCPTLAYEKDAVTGIVRHLDDQCIGCRYCELKCPYEVPKYNDRLGIVRKCDMCHGRLAQGEAPACVQACPNQAIRITTVSAEESHPQTSETTLLPGTVPSNYTKPTTRFINQSKAAEPPPLPLKTAHGHFPLAWMLVMTQAGIGILSASFLTQRFPIALAGVIFFFLGLGGSFLHLGQPLKAWKAFLGWKTSWLSREIIAFGGVAALSLGYLVTKWPLLGLFSCVAGMLAIWTSVMVYADTRRTFWNCGYNSIRFYLSAIGFGLIFSPSPVLASLPILGTISFDLFLSHSKRKDLSFTRELLRGALNNLFVFRCFTGIAAVIFLSTPWVSLILFALSELAAKSLFFQAVEEPGMPGTRSKNAHD